jgi:hypothetical protein
MAIDPKCANHALNINQWRSYSVAELMVQVRQFFRHGDRPASIHQPYTLHGRQGPDLGSNRRAEQKYRLEEIAAWGYPDNVFASDYDIVSYTSKARRLGFHDLIDTEEMFLRMFSDFRRNRIIP